ncbi:helix-turn-helix transcriptional regulator [Dactylosporangium sp. AC04546]|uniref:helix-turn-helix domain-containing protein n=1 Tax=Dactylosporangium sp. AC04546 TaxID=2862460 RepID=UPI001EDDA068|nr:helix-turn-helix transcriptional regulator [Dactylosporangium sp. AC04546]WVK78906.1 helix-turn-helix transcriptional regulator [Dactylosporangium sp. AC04546]
MVVAGQVKFWRDQRKLSANELSQRTAELGSEVPRSVIANLENGRRESISVDELLILGAALNVPPLLLLTPVGRVQNLRILPDVESTPWFSRGWIIGARLVDYAGSSVQKWRDGRRVVALYDVHRTLVQQYVQVQARIRRIADQTQLAARTALDHERFLQALVNELARSLHALRTHRQLIEREGFLIPELPPALTTLLNEVEVPDQEEQAPEDWGNALADQSAAEELLLILRQAQAGRPTDEA